MKRKNAFTLVELLAVIAILAILIIIALPNILRMFNNAKKNSFVTEARSIFKTAEQNYISSNGENYCYSDDYEECPALDMSGRNNIHYIVSFDENGNIVEFGAADDNFYLYIPYGNVISIEDITVEILQEGL